jgi:hypothetical protein
MSASQSSEADIINLSSIEGPEALVILVPREALHGEEQGLVSRFLEETKMNTSILTVVLTGALLAGQSGSPTWQNSYSSAQRVAAQQQKPVLVVVGNGADGWKQVIRDVSPEAMQVLAQKYVCVYVDTATPAGRQLAQSFEINGSGLVISDRTGTLQAFWHQGTLSGEAVGSVLTRYSDPQYSVRTTETNASRTSYYPADTSSTGYQQPGAGGVNWGAYGGGSYCPSCNNARGRR